jgi:beta-lactam-binding protein with PASTA domain
MSLPKYLISRVFLVQVFLAVLIIAVLLGFLYALVDFTTDHGNEITVPNLSKLTEEQEKLDELDLDYVLLDSVNYKSDFPKFSVVQQDPLPGEK